MPTRWEQFDISKQNDKNVIICFFTETFRSTVLNRKITPDCFRCLLHPEPLYNIDNLNLLIELQFGIVAYFREVSQILRCHRKYQGCRRSTGK